MSLWHRPLSVRAAERINASLHRHLPHVQGGLFALGAVDGQLTVGVAIVARPCRSLDDGFTADIKRVATDGFPNACSFLYGRCKRVLRTMGYRKVITYTRTDEGGASLRAAGFKLAAVTRADHGDRPSRRRERKELVKRFRWEVAL